MLNVLTLVSYFRLRKQDLLRVVKSFCPLRKRFHQMFCLLLSVLARWTPCESTSSASCFDTAISVVNAMVQHYDWANYGLVRHLTTLILLNRRNGLIKDCSLALPIRVASGITGLSTHSTTTNDLSEAITNAYELYLRNGATADALTMMEMGLPKTGTKLQFSTLVKRHILLCSPEASQSMMIIKV